MQQNVLFLVTPMPPIRSLSAKKILNRVLVIHRNNTWIVAIINTKINIRYLFSLSDTNNR